MDDSARWNAVRFRDLAQEGSFVYGVRTTRVFCRVGCPSRTPRRINVLYFRTPSEALANGYRPCKRCRPTDTPEANPNLTTICAIQEVLLSATPPPTLAALGARFNLSPTYLQKLFRRHVGMTPSVYARAIRTVELVKSLNQSQSVTELAFAAGFTSLAQANRDTQAALGMSPNEVRRGGNLQIIEYAVIRHEDWFIGVASTQRGLSAVVIHDSDEQVFSDLTDRFPHANFTRVAAEEHRFSKFVEVHLTNPNSPFDASIFDIVGTPFQMAVWNAICSLQLGQTITYSELASRAGFPSAVRAVASACGRNPLALVIPCHRVVPHDGSIGKYRWGANRKRRLLEQEARAMQSAVTVVPKTT